MALFNTKVRGTNSGAKTNLLVDATRATP